MQTPYRKYDKIPRQKSDPHITEDKFLELKSKVNKLKNIQRPREAEEVKRLAAMGDFSENAGYQLAKSRLRGINQRILDIEDLLARAEIIQPLINTGKVQLGNYITIENLETKKNKTYQLLGSAETNPLSGIISHNSPLGSALLDKSVNDIIRLEINSKLISYKIIKIE
jgi:transcription elongation factor GreA